MKLTNYEREYINHPEQYTFDYFKTQKLDNNPAPVALSLADEELLNHYYNKYEFKTRQRTRFILQMDGNSPAYSELEKYIAETSVIVLSEQFPAGTEISDCYIEFTEFRRKLQDSLHSYPEAQKVTILKKLGININYSPSEIDQISRLFSTESSLFAMELYLNLKREEKLEDYLNRCPRSEKAFKRIAETPCILLDLWDHQKKARQNWINAGGKGIVQMATATGKTLVGLASAYDLFSREGSLNVLVICHSKAILNQWRREVIEKLGFLGNGDDSYTKPLTFRNKFVFQFETIQKVMKDPASYKSDLLIVDEVHHGAGARFRDALSVPCNWKLGLSATVEGQEKNTVLKEYLGKSVFTYTLKDARNDHIIPDFKLVIHKTFLDIAEEEEFDLITEKIISLLNFINATQKREIFNLSKKRFERFENLGDFVRLMKNIRYQGDDVPKEWNHLMGLINKRRWVIHRSSPKIAHAINLTEKVAPDHKCVLFAMDIATCKHINKSLSGSLPSFLIHSGLKEAEKDSQFRQFKNSSNGVLIAPKMLDEGIDLPDVDVGINVASSKTELQLIQRLGRILRNCPGKKPVFHHFVAVPRNYIVSEDSFTFQNDLGWITDVALKMGIPIEEVIHESEYFSAFEREAESAVSQYFTGHESLKTENFGDINVQNLVDSILPEAQTKLIHLLGMQNDKITDRKWADILRSAYSDESMLEIPSHRWLLVIGDRNPEKIQDLINNHRTLTENPETTPKTVNPNSKSQERAVPDPSSKKSSSVQDSSGIPFYISILRKNRSQSENDRAVSALIKQGETAVELLIELLNCKEPAVQLHVIRALEQIGNRKSVDQTGKRTVVDAIINCFVDKKNSLAVRLKALHAVGKLGDKKARIPLLKLHDPNLEVKKAVKNALEKLKD